MWSLMFTPSGPQDIPTAHTQPLCCSRVQKAFARCWIYLQREAQDRWWPELFYNVLIPCHFHYSAELTLVHIFYICRVLQYFSQSFQQQGCLVVSICDIFSLLEHLIQSCRLHLQSVRTFSFINSNRQFSQQTNPIISAWYDTVSCLSPEYVCLHMGKINLRLCHWK